jgi:SAM-dependent methyltransferase
LSYYSDIDNTYNKHRKEKLFYRYFADIKGLILDIGCTTGLFVQHAPNRIIGVDIDKDALTICKSLGYICQCTDIVNGLPFKDASFAAINCDSVIEHISDPLSMMKEIYRVLRPNGLAILVTPNIYRVKHKFWRDYTHIRPFCPESITRLAYDAGFRNMRVCNYSLNYFGTITRFLKSNLVNGKTKWPTVWWIEDQIGRFAADNIILHISK